MPEQESTVYRHPLRVWLKWAIESGLLEKLPPEYRPDQFDRPLHTEPYARQLLAELRDPDSSRRTIREIIALARQFRTWVEARQKDYRRLVLRELGYQRAHHPTATETHPQATAHPQFKPGRTHRSTAGPGLNPMWDDWLDA